MSEKLFWAGDGEWVPKAQIVAQAWEKVDDRSGLHYSLRRSWHKLRTGRDLPSRAASVRRAEWLESL